jgi:hypothetical protein
MRAMVPEFQQLEQRQVFELREMETSYQQQEKDLQNEYQLKCQRELQVQKQSLCQQNDDDLKELKRVYQRDIDEIATDHSRHISALMREHENNIEALQLQLATKNERERRKGGADVQGVQEEVNRNIQLLQGKFSEEIDVLKKNNGIHVSIVRIILLYNCCLIRTNIS